MGAHFTHLAFAASWDALDHLDGWSVWAADTGGTPIGASRPERLMLVVGNEGAGVSAETRRRADRVISIPIAQRVESLNVAVAAAILLYELGA
jgi:TrmH family RNA methyltransferase